MEPVWFKHKTRRIIGPRHVCLLLDNSWLHVIDALEKRKLHQSVISPAERDWVEKCLNLKKIRLHSVRRSGLRYWRKTGMSLPDLMIISLHTSLAALIAYLEGADDDSDDEPLE